MSEKLSRLRVSVKKLYDDNNDLLLFHGWHHIQFVTNKAAKFAKTIDADVELVETSALVHDLNYIVEVNSEPEAGAKLRDSVLSEAGYSNEEINRIEDIIDEAHTANRGVEISPEGMALSDGDTLFKALPITPILFSSKYITQNKIDLGKLAHKVVSEQRPLLEQGIYFYTDDAKQYLKWAQTNIDNMAHVQEALEDPDVRELIETAYQRNVL